MVLEIPPADEGSITGSIDRCVASGTGRCGPAGVDKGKGGKYLILPPGYKEKPPGGYIALQSDTYQGYALLRSNSQKRQRRGYREGRRIRQADQALSAPRRPKPPDTTFVDAIDVVFDTTIPYDKRFFQSLDRMVQAEPWLSGTRR